MSSQTAPTPTADDVRRMFKRSNVLTGIGAVVITVLASFAVWFSYGSRVAGQDNATSSSALFASQARSACITDLRSDESDAQGREQDALLRAVQALGNRDMVEFAKQIQLGTDAAADRETAARALDKDALNRPRPVGCGPPIVSADQLNGGDTNR